MVVKMVHSGVQKRRVVYALGLVAVFVAIILSSCGGEPTVVEEVPSPTPAPATQEPEKDPLQGVADLISTVQSEQSAIPLTFDIELTASGPSPAHLFIPAEKVVQLIFRNRAQGEFHYKVVGLVPDNIQWISVPEEDVEREEDVSDEDHEAHHDRDFVPWRAMSKSGIQPTGEQIHGYTTVGELDVIKFIARNVGTYEVVDPLHPEFSAQLTVF